MPYRIITVSLRDEEAGSARLNQFLAGHRVLSVRDEFVADGENSFWTFRVEYLSSPADSPVRGDGVGKTGRIDYKEILSAGDFAVFVRLRDLRKRIAAEEGVPLFTIFTNEQLAAMVTNRCASLADLRKIDGVGEARAGKYGERFLAAGREADEGEEEGES